MELISFTLAGLDPEKGYKIILKKPNGLHDAICDLLESVYVKVADTSIEFSVYIVYHRSSELTGEIAPEQGNIFLPEKLVLSQKKLSDNLSKGDYYPILHLSAADLLSGDKRVVHQIRYFNILDNSIWNYYFPFELYYKEHDDALLKLGRIFTAIVNNQMRGYYKLSIAKEYAQLNSRLVLNNYTDLTGHGAFVSPFLFHSESKMREEVSELRQKINYKWRFLLLDDRAMDSLRIEGEKDLPTFDIEKKDLVITSKLSILKAALEEMKFTVSWKYFPSDSPLAISSDNYDDSNVDICIWTTTSVKGAIRLISQFKFEIILLDYLLSDHSLKVDDYNVLSNDLEKQQQYKVSSEIINELKTDLQDEMLKSSKEYGYHLLKYLKRFLDADENSPFSGPVGRQYFMFISAFTTAVGERLRAEGLNQSEPYWEIGEGACPTNTPELFKFRLLQLMDNRLKQTCIKDLSYSELLNNLKFVFSVKKEDTGKDKVHQRIKSVREKAYEKYKYFLGLHYDYFALQEDKDESPLVNSYLEKQVQVDALLEHLLQLIHLVAFGTVRQWPEIWEEFQFVVRSFNNPEKDDGLKWEVFQMVEDYITDLKSA